MLTLSHIFDLLLAPLQGRSPWIGMLALSFTAGVIAMAIIKFSSNPERVRTRRNRALSRLLELWLYRDDLILQARAMAGVPLDNLRYVAALALPLLLSLAPMILLLTQAHDHFNGRSLRARDTVNLEVRFDDPAQAVANGGPRLETGPVFEPDPPSVRAPALGAVIWRLTVAENAPPGRHALRLYLADNPEPLRKDVVIGAGFRRLSPQRVAGLGAHLLFPGEARLPVGSGLSAIEIAYPPPDPLLGRLRFDGIWTFLVLTLVWGLVLKRPMRVEI